MFSYGYVGGAMILFDAVKAVDLKATERIVIIALCRYANKEGKCWPSQKAIAEYAGLGLTATKSALKSLQSKGYISITQRRSEKGDLTSCMYQLNIEKQAPKTSNPDDKVVRIHRTTEGKAV